MGLNSLHQPLDQLWYPKTDIHTQSRAFWESSWRQGRTPTGVADGTRVLFLGKLVHVWMWSRAAWIKNSYPLFPTYINLYFGQLLWSNVVCTWHFRIMLFWKVLKFSLSEKMCFNCSCKLILVSVPEYHHKQPCLVSTIFHRHSLGKLQLALQISCKLDLFSLVELVGWYLLSFFLCVLQLYYLYHSWVAPIN